MTYRALICGMFARPCAPLWSLFNPQLEKSTSIYCSTKIAAFKILVMIIYRSWTVITCADDWHASYPSTANGNRSRPLTDLKERFQPPSFQGHKPPPICVSVDVTDYSACITLHCGSFLFRFILNFHLFILCKHRKGGDQSELIVF